MFDFRFEVLNFGRKLFGPSSQKDFFVIDRSLSATKNFESQLTFWGPSKLAEVSVDLHWWGQDHAGPKFELELFGFYFSICIYDGRHWNHDAGRWYRPGEEAELYGDYDESQLGI